MRPSSAGAFAAVVLTLGIALPPAGRAESAPGVGPPIVGELIGLDAATLEARLGPRAFRRLDPPAEFRRYRIGGCALHLILYAHPETGGSTVAYAAFHPAAARRVAGGSCSGLWG